MEVFSKEKIKEEVLKALNAGGSDIGLEDINSESSVADFAIDSLNLIDVFSHFDELALENGLNFDLGLDGLSSDMNGDQIADAIFQNLSKNN